MEKENLENKAKKKVLLVGLQKDVGSNVDCYLRDSGYETVLAQDLKDAKKYFSSEENVPNYCMVDPKVFSGDMSKIARSYEAFSERYPTRFFLTSVNEKEVSLARKNGVEAYVHDDALDVLERVPLSEN